MNLFLRWSKKEYPLWQRLIAGLLAGGVFALLIPWLLLRGLPRLNDALGWPSMNLGMAGLVIGIALVVVGLPIGFWTVVDQYYPRERHAPADDGHPAPADRWALCLVAQSDGVRHAGCLPGTGLDL